MIVNNRTRRYLYPIINSFGKTFLRELQEITSYARASVGQTILQVNINDIIYYRCKGFSNNLFLIFDTRGVYDFKKGKYVNPIESKKRFLNFLNFARTNKHYVFDYQFEYQKKHCIVFDIPLEYRNSYEQFLKGAYSKMYSLDQIEFLGHKPFLAVGKQNTLEPNRNYIVLTRNHDLGKTVLKQAVQQAYGVSEPPENPDEYDIPWDLYEEILNFDYAKDNEVEFFKQLKR